MDRLVLTVEETFFITGLGGLIVEPGPLRRDWSLPMRLAVELRKPDGENVQASLSLRHTHQSPPAREPRMGCVLEGLNKEDVPIGTQIWVCDADDRKP